MKGHSRSNSPQGDSEFGELGGSPDPKVVAKPSRWQTARGGLQRRSGRPGPGDPRGVGTAHRWRCSRVNPEPRAPSRSLNHRRICWRSRERTDRSNERRPVQDALDRHTAVWTTANGLTVSVSSSGACLVFVCHVQALDHNEGFQTDPGLHGGMVQGIKCSSSHRPGLSSDQFNVQETRSFTSSAPPVDPEPVTRDALRTM